MCGRFVLYTNHQQIAKIFAIKQSEGYVASYNVAPTQLIAVVRNNEDGTRVLEKMRWGLIPFWQKKPTFTTPLINARVETIDQKPAFKRLIKRKRCLIIADGFYEWTHTAKGVKQPYYIHMRNQQPFALAGIWDTWSDDLTTIDSCCIITIPANATINPYHDRMPAIVDPLLIQNKT